MTGTVSRDPGPRLGLLLLTVIWGVNFAVVKEALETFEPLAFNALRFPIAALILWVALRRRGAIPIPEKRDLPLVLALGVLGNVVYQLLFIIGIDLTYAGNASLMLATSPVWTLVLATLMGIERHGALVWIGVVGTLLGLVLVVVGGEATVSAVGGIPLGDLLLIAGAITWAGYTVFGQRLTEKYGSLALTAWTLWIGTVGLCVLGLPALLRTDYAAAGAFAWGAIVYAGVFAIAVAYLLWYRGVERIGSSRTAVFSNLIPVVALATSAVWLGERPGPLQLVGAAVVIGGVWIAQVGRRSRRS